MVVITKNMRDILTSPRIEEIKHRRRVRNLRMTIIFSVVLVLLIAALSYLSSNPKITIDNIVVTGNHIVSTQDIEDNVNKNLSGKFLYLFTKSNSLIYSHDKIYSDLMKSFPRINTLSVYRDNWKTLHIDITERMGSYLYCGSQIPEVINDVGDNCYFINNDGYIFDKAPYFSGNVYFKYYVSILDNDSVQVENPLMKNVLSTETFHNVVRFVDGVTSLGFKPIYLYIGQDGVYTLYLSHNTGETSPTIIFKNENNLDTILSNLTTAMSKKEFADEINSKYTSLQYIDLRFKNKVLYKFQ